MSSIIEEINRISDAKLAIKNAIISKGVVVEDEHIEDYAGFISQIQSGQSGFSTTILNQLRFKMSITDERWEDLGFDQLDVSQVKDMDNMFDGCVNLKKPDMTNWNMSNVKTSELFFNDCDQLYSIIGEHTQEDVNNGLSVLNGLTSSLDVSTTIMDTPSICAIIRGIGTVSSGIHTLSMTVAQYNLVSAIADIDYINMAETKGWTIDISDKIQAQNIAGSIIGKDAQGQIVYVKYQDFIKDTFNTESFTPISVVVIPSDHTKDGKCRGISLVNMDATVPETGSSTSSRIRWGVYGTDQSLTNYSSSTTGNAPSSGYQLGVNNISYLPVDKFTQTPSMVDITDGVVQSFYGSSTPYMPSPYGEQGVANIQYLEGSDANSVQCNTDVNGNTNTQTIINVVSKGSASGILTQVDTAISNVEANYPAFTTCYRYKGGNYSDHSWYLPSCGELGYCSARFNTINASLTSIKTKYGSDYAFPLETGTSYWSSTEYNTNYARFIILSQGSVSFGSKRSDYAVRAFHAF